MMENECTMSPDIYHLCSTSELIVCSFYPLISQGCLRTPVELVVQRTWKLREVFPVHQLSPNVNPLDTAEHHTSKGKDAELNPQRQAFIQQQPICCVKEWEAFKVPSLFSAAE